MKNTIVMTFMILLVASCGGDKSTLTFSLPTVASKPQVEAIKISEDRMYDLLSEKIFEKSCTKCHNPESHRTKNRIDLKDRESIIRDYELILYRMTEAFDKKDRPMPPRSAPVDARLIQVFRTWKENGFKESP